MPIAHSSGMTILKPIYAHPPERVAATVDSTLITYGRLCADIDAMAHWLLGAGLEPGDRVTLHAQATANTSYWDWIMNLGAIRAGLVHSNGGMPPAVAASGAIGPYAAAVGALGTVSPKANPARKLAFTPQGSASARRADRDQGRMPARSMGWRRTPSACFRLRALPGSPRWSSGMPALFEARLKQVREIGDIAPDTVLLSLLGLATTTGLRYPIAAWQIGATVLLASFGGEKPDFAALTAASTFLATSPFRMQEILEACPRRTGPDARRACSNCSAGGVPPLLREEVLAHCCSTLRMSYGATEVGRVAAGPTTLVDRHPGAVGMVEPGITVEIVDPKGVRSLPARPGMVRMKSDFMVGSYAGQAAATGPRAPFRDGWFYPGDIGILYEDGLFAITGRTSETLNLSGAKLSPVVLEERLAKLPEVQDVCVVTHAARSRATCSRSPRSARPAPISLHCARRCARCCPGSSRSCSSPCPAFPATRWAGFRARRWRRTSPRKSSSAAEAGGARRRPGFSGRTGSGGGTRTPDTRIMIPLL